MSFIYKNPSVGTTLSTPDVVTRLSVVGSNFSVLTAGGYMEVWSLSDLNYQTFGGSGLIENSGNTIPIYYSKSNLGFIASKVTIEDDGITSGRRRLGMQVYVHETDTVYQYVIPNYETLFNNASGSTEEDPSTGKYVVSDNTVDGLAFVNAWLDSSIEGVSGVTRANARWRIFYGTDVTVTGGTYTNGTAIFTNSTGGTFNVTGFTTGSTSYTSWEATGDNQTPAVPIDVVDTFTLKFTGAITSGGAGIVTDSAISANEMTIGLINNGGSPTDKTFYRGDGEWQTPTDTKLTGGTYNNSTGIVQLKNSDSSTVTLTGFTTGATEDTFVTGITYNQLSKTLTLGLNDGVDFNATGFAAEVTGGTYSGGSITLNNNDGTTSQVTGLEILTHIGLVNDTNVSINGTTIDSVNTTTYKGAFFDYVINDGTNYRAGTVQSVWSATQIQFNDSSTVDIGTTTNFSWGMTLSGGNALLQANILGGTWDIRIIKHII
jgi:hypothetical protein